MSTDRPRYTVSVDDELLKLIEDFRHTNQYQTRSQATVDLIARGLKTLNAPLVLSDVKNIDATTAAQRVAVLYDKASKDDKNVVEAVLRKYAAAEETAADLAPVLVADEEADKFAAMAREQYLLQKKQESEASSAKKSG